MSNNSLFEISKVNVDMKEYSKVRCKSALNDNVIFKFLVFDMNSPVDLSQYKVEFRARLSNGVVYSEVDNISINGNELIVNCDSRLCSQIGEQIITLRIVDITNYKQKSNYIIILKVMSTIDADEEVQAESILSPLESLDIAINRYLELKVDLQAEITLAQTTLTALTNEVTLANTTLNNMVAENTLLITSYNNAVTMNDKLDNNVNRAVNLDAQVEKHITDLSSNIAVAKYYDNELKATTTSAQILDTNLKNENTWASEQIAIMKSFGDIKTLVTIMSNYKIELDSLSHFVDIIMQSNPINWVDDNGNNVLDDNGTVITV